MKEFHPFSDSDSADPILAKVSFLGGMNEEQRKVVSSYFETATYKKGEYVARHGEEPTHIHIIKSGSVHLLIEDGDKRVEKRTFNAGDCFGEAAMLSLINNTASFICAEDTTLIVFSRKGFNRLRKEDPTAFCQLLLNLARELARKLQFSDDILLHPER